jgi:hypothetical protein
MGGGPSTLQQQCTSRSGDPRSASFYNTTGAADANYNQWLQANPAPAQPALQELVPISFSINCDVCTQNLQQGNITAGSVKEADINQTMDCFNKQISAAQAKADADAAAAKTAADAAKAAQDQAGLASIASIAGGGSSSYMIYIVIFIAIIVIAMVIFFMRSGAPAYPPYGQYPPPYGQYPPP